MRIYVSLIVSLFSFILAHGQVSRFDNDDRSTKAINERLKPIDDSKGILNDFSFLKELLADKRIIYLGESNHHSETYNIIKFQVIQFLHSEMGYNVIAFESNMSSCIHSNLVRDSLSSLYILTHSILGSWRTESNYKLMSFVKNESIDITGFDPNLNSLILDKKFYRVFFPNNLNLSTKLFLLDSTFQEYTANRNQYLYSKKSNISKENELNEVRDSLILGYTNFINTKSSSKEGQLLQFTIENKIKLLKVSNHFSDDKEHQFISGEVREKMMAENLEFILDSIYPNQKVIIWAHNEHISKGGSSTFYSHNKNNTIYLNNSLGYRLKHKYGNQSFTIGLYGYPGIIGKGYTSETTSLAKPKKKSVELILSNCREKTFFITTDIECFKQPLYNFSEGNYAHKSIISDCYDAIIFCKDLSPSILIKYEDKEKYK